MKHARIFSLITAALALAYGAIGFYFLPLANFQGDLTRMGMLPESAFGWRKQQPALDARWLQQSAMQEADVLVIGDSFSGGRVWQTVLTQHGLKVRTEGWDVMRAICTDFSTWLKSSGFHGRFVVFEIIERDIADKLNDSIACVTMQPHTNVSADQPRSPPPVSFDTEERNYSGKLSVGLKTALDLRRYLDLSHTPNFAVTSLPNGVRLARVMNGCDLFSHRYCNDSLFLAADRQDNLADKLIDQIAQLNQRMPGISPIWAFVPNKSTAYLYPDKPFWNQAEQQFNAPNLLRMTQQAIANKTVDLYPANNTHFSTTGYLLMGATIYRSMQTARPN